MRETNKKKIKMKKKTFAINVSPSELSFYSSLWLLILVHFQLSFTLTSTHNTLWLYQLTIAIATEVWDYFSTSLTEENLFGYVIRDARTLSNCVSFFLFCSIKNERKLNE